MENRVKILNKTGSLLNQIVFELRDENIQKDRDRFRKNLERAGEILAYEISKELNYESRTVTTPLGTLDMDLPERSPVLVSILRAGMPLHQGFLRMYDQADNGFISSYRHHTKGNKFIVKVEYSSVPDITGRDVILIDPMIATGKSLVLSYQEMVEAAGRPENVFVATVVGSEEGVDYVLRQIPKAQIFLCAVDHELTARSYIVPGLGDAGDLAYGPK